MPEWSSIGSWGREVDAWGKSMELEAKRKTTHAQAEDMQKIAAREVAIDVGSDRAMSGFRRGNKIELDTQLKHLANGDTLVTPKKGAGGAWTINSEGRNQGNASGFSGPGISIRTGLTSRTKSGGLRKVRSRKGRRWNGTTQGKHTSTRILREVDRRAEKIAEPIVRKVTAKHFDVS